MGLGWRGRAIEPTGEGTSPDSFLPLTPPSPRTGLTDARRKPAFASGKDDRTTPAESLQLQSRFAASHLPLSERSPHRCCSRPLEVILASWRCVSLRRHEEARMRRTISIAALLGSVALLVAGTIRTRAAAVYDHTTGPREVVLRDDCDPNDPGWTPTGGCTLPEGEVTLAEFNAQRLSPLAPSVIGHLA